MSVLYQGLLRRAAQFRVHPDSPPTVNTISRIPPTRTAHPTYILKDQSDPLEIILSE
jgi:hypothetical protein